MPPRSSGSSGTVSVAYGNGPNRASSSSIADRVHPVSSRAVTSAPGSTPVVGGEGDGLGAGDRAQVVVQPEVELHDRSTGVGRGATGAAALGLLLR
jgi:hypothetical protein